MMPSMSLTLALLGPARAYCAAKGITLSALSRAALGDWRRLPHLEAGECSITLASAERVLAYIAADWPADLDWPADGYALVPTGPAPAATCLATSAAALVTSAAEAIGAATRAMADGRVTAAERKDLDRALAEAERAARAMRKALRDGARS